MLARLEQQLTALLVEPVSAVGFELLGVELVSSGWRVSTVRIYIDSPSGVTVDDCALVSGQISAALDVEDPIDCEYNLEVSSPGLDRPLFSAEHFARFIGHLVLIHLHNPIRKRGKLRGKIVKVVDEEITLTVEQQEVVLMFSDIRKANLTPTFA